MKPIAETLIFILIFIKKYIQVGHLRKQTPEQVAQGGRAKCG